MSCEITSSSLTPAFTSFSASRSTSAAGRETRSPRSFGMMQKRAAVVAAFGNLQIGVVPRRQLDALRRHQIEIGIVLRRRRAVHGLEHALILLRPGDRQHVGIGAFGSVRARRPCSR